MRPGTEAPVTRIRRELGDQAVGLITIQKR